MFLNRVFRALGLAITLVGRAMAVAALSLMLAPVLQAGEKMIVTHPDVDLFRFGSKPDYEVPLIALALEKTRATHGDYELRQLGTTTHHLTHLRRVKLMETNLYENLLMSHGYTEALDEHLALVKFPVYLGILSYRTCFMHPAIKEAFASATRMGDMLQFTHGVGIGWADSDVLKYNGFKVREAANLQSLYRMTGARRFDVFCRGATEAMDEYERFASKDIHYDRSAAFYYPMPVFLYTNKANTKLIERLEKGLLIAHGDGSLQALWDKNFKQSVDFQEFDKRKVFVLDNPLTHSIDFEYESYFYQNALIPRK